ncbi:MAG: prepilin-type N-terminal cleavage/methylation domain-containing protein [Thermodesulfovibrionales bacterium]
MRNSGFTLVEILIAFTISLLLILLIFSGFRLSSRSYEKIFEQDEISQRIRVLNERIGWLIRGIYPYKIIDKEGKERLFL